jgi:F5/8 type C domain
LPVKNKITKLTKIISIFLISFILLLSYSAGMSNVEAKKSDSTASNSIIPSVKLIFDKKSYEMLPFVVIKDQKTEKLNFPVEADDAPPVAKIPSTDTIGFEFSSSPREKSAYLIDYDADSSEISQLNKVDENSFAFTNFFGLKTLEVRAIYPDGTYVTYTTLIDILDKAQPSQVSSSSLISQKDAVSNLNYVNPGSSKSGSQSLETLGSSPLTTEERILQEYSKIVRLDNYKKDAVNSESSDNSNIDVERKESGATGDNSCQLKDIPIATIVSNKNEVSDQMVNQNNKLSWMKLDLGQPKQICGLRIQFALNSNVNFFTMSFSNDGISYSTPEYLANTGTSSSSEIFNPQNGPVTARYIKLDQLATGGINSDWITSVKVLGVT